VCPINVGSAGALAGHCEPVQNCPKDNDRCQGRQELRTRRYVRREWLLLLRPLFRYSYGRDAFVLRGVGRSFGPVLRPDRRLRAKRTFDGIERRGPRIAA
jgi:hypothetical protein